MANKTLFKIIISDMESYRKLRKPLPPPGGPMKSKKEYDRKKSKKAIKEEY